LQINNMPGLDAIAELKPITPPKPIIETPPDVIDPIASKETSEMVTRIEDSLAKEVPPEDIISDLASDPVVDTSDPGTEDTSSSTSSEPETGSSAESSDILDWTEVSADVDMIEEEFDRDYPEPDGIADPTGHFKWFKQKNENMMYALQKRAVNKRLERWEKKNPAPSTDDEEAYKEWSNRKNQEEQKIRNSYEKYSDKRESKKKKEGELNEAEILRLVNQLRSKSMISADYAQAIALLRSRPPTPESKLQIAEFQKSKQSVDSDIARINQLLTGEVSKASLMKKIRLMALIAGAAVAYGTFKAAKSAEEPVRG
jgi:hypothetical protein